MFKNKMSMYILAVFICQAPAFGDEGSQGSNSKHLKSHVSSTVTANTECRAGCQGSTTGCQESYQTAVLAASPGMRLYVDTLEMSNSWPGGDTTGLVREPQWDIKSVPEGAERPVSIRVKPVVASCEGRDAHTQSRTHYQWTVVQGPP